MAFQNLVIPNAYHAMAITSCLAIDNFSDRIQLSKKDCIKIIYIPEMY